ncbi:MAG: hypothetical protein ACRCYO_08240 [Bacteroidia bacterium]
MAKYYRQVNFMLLGCAKDIGFGRISGKKSAKKENRSLSKDTKAINAHARA